MNKLYIYIKRYSFSQFLWAIIISITDRAFNSFAKKVPYRKLMTKNFYNVIFQNGSNVQFHEDGLLSFDYPINKVNTKLSIRYKDADPFVFLQIIKSEEYHILTELLTSAGTTEPKIIDAGSNIGLTSVYFKRYFPDAEIISLEPNMQNFEIQKRIFSANNLQNCHMLKFAVWDKVTNLKPRKFRDNLSWAFALAETDKVEEALFPATTLQKVMEQRRWSKIDLLKIDIEGSEKILLENQSFLQEILPVTAFIALEVHAEIISRASVSSILSAQGFRTFTHGELIIGINSTPPVR